MTAKEIWFVRRTRFLRFELQPCHWKGHVLVYGTVIAFALVWFFGEQWVPQRYAYLRFPYFAVLVGGALYLAYRHSAPAQDI